MKLEGVVARPIYVDAAAKWQPEAPASVFNAFFDATTGLAPVGRSLASYRSDIPAHNAP
jgi:hypothetical protein